MYAGRQKTVTLMPLQQIGLGFGIALFGLVLLLAGKAAFERAQKNVPGLAHNLSHGADRELAPDASRANVPAQSRAYATPVPFAPPAPLPALRFGGKNASAFVGDNEKQAAQELLVPLHELLEAASRFDRVIGGQGVPDTGQNVEAATGNPALLLDALEAQTDVTAHPARFPDALQDDAEQMTLQIRTYIADVRAAGIGASEIKGGRITGGDTGSTGGAKSGYLSPAVAQEHLQEAAQSLARLDTLAGGVLPPYKQANPNRSLPTTVVSGP